MHSLDGLGDKLARKQVLDASSRSMLQSTTDGPRFMFIHGFSSLAATPEERLANSFKDQGQNN
jgi:hypothetical protein